MTNTQVYKTLLSIVFAILVMLVFMVAITGCRNPSAPKPECDGIFVNGECEEEEPEEISQETIDLLFVTGMNTPLEGP
jgi:hypothetical protein